MKSQGNGGSFHKTLIKSTFSISFFTLISRVFGYIRDMLQAYFLGTGFYGDAYTIAYRIPNLLRRIVGEGAMTASFIPVFAEAKKKEGKESWVFANTFFWNLLLIVALIVIIGIIFSPLIVKIMAYGFKQIPGKWGETIYLNRLMFPYILFISLSALAMGILNSYNIFSVPASTPVLFNLAIIGSVLLFLDKFKSPATAFAIGVVLGGIFQLLFQLPFLIKIGMRFRPKISFGDSYVRRTGKLMVPGIFGASAVQINIFINSQIASLLPQGAVSSLYYADRVMELTLGAFSIALATALLPLLSRQASENDINSMKNSLRFSIKLTSFITLPAAIGLIALSNEIISVLFQRGIFNVNSTEMTSFALIFHSLGLPFISGVKILAPGFYSLKDTATPVKISFISIGANIVLALVLMDPLKQGGIALAVSIASLINFLLLWVYLEKKIGKIEKNNLISVSMKSFLSSIIMGVFLLSVKRRVFSPDEPILNKVFELIILIISGIIIYSIFSYIFNRNELKSAMKFFRKKDKL
ncbi:MAG: murein biosynthesis integral membrane protein MurJ [Acidobacteriota bacterium]